LDWCCGDAEGVTRGFHQRSDNNSNNSNNESSASNDLILVRVPPGSAPGSTIRVRIDDGRLVEAVVPAANEGEEGRNAEAAAEFFLRVPPMEGARASPRGRQQQQGRQNWHDHPLAIAPVALGPLL
jgi:hypothetical protein